jgi:hypothetical protein
MWNRKLNINVTSEMVEELKDIKGFDCDVEKELVKLLKIKNRKKKLEKICGRITEEKQK